MIHTGKKIQLALALLLWAVLLAGCAQGALTEQSQEQQGIAPEDISAEYDPASAARITLGESISIKGSGAELRKNVITIFREGTYIFEGALPEGQLIVDAADASVQIVLNNASLSCSYSAALYVKDAARVILTLADGTVNSLSDGSSRPADDSIDGAIFARSPLAVNGGGSLTVNGTYKHGISSKDAVTLSGGSLSLSAPKTGLDSRGDITLSSCTLKVDAGTNGIRSGREDEAADINILSGTYALSSAGDGMQSYGGINISGGSITVITGGGSAEAPVKYSEFSAKGRNAQTQATEDETSRKGIKASGDISISGGSCQVDAYDDGIHSDGDIAISAGSLSVSSGDDGLHAEGALLVSGGSIDVSYCYEGLEGKSVTIEDGVVDIHANDDGINTAADEADRADPQLPAEGATPQMPQNMTPPADMESPEGAAPPMSMEPPQGEIPQRPERTSDAPPSSPDTPSEENSPSGGMPGGGRGGRGDKQGGMGGFGGETAQEGVDITITGGTVTVSAEGDCMDSNGSIFITGGTVYVSASRYPVISAAEAGLDCNGSLTVSGGSLMGTGTSASQTDGLLDAAIVYYGDSAFDADTALSLSDAAGNILFEFTSAHSFNSVLIASPALTVGETYTLAIGNAAEEIQLTEQLLTVGESSGGFGGMGGFGGRHDRSHNADPSLFPPSPGASPAA